MPFTPYHMGPGLLLKAVLRGSFSLLVFGWTQFLMDLQPLFALTTGVGKLHGFTHTYVGATLIALVAAVSGKYFGELGLAVLAGDPPRDRRPTIAWWVAAVSAVVGSFSHVALDSLMHRDMAPYLPVSSANHLLGLVTVPTLHRACLVSGIVGAVGYLAVGGLLAVRRRRSTPPAAEPPANRPDDV